MRPNQLFGAIAAVVAMAFTVTPASAQGARDWSGFYLGGNIGGVMTSTDWDYFNLPGQSLTRDAAGFVGGFQAGAQTQFKQVVVGFEVSFSQALFGKITDTGPDAPVFAPAFDARITTNYFYTFGPRVGWVFNNQWMGYVGAGGASAHVDTSFFARGFPTIAARTEDNHYGWYVGGGVEYAMTKHWFLGLDYKHMELDTELQSSTPVPATGAAHYVTPTIDILTARLNYKF